ncbi:MAG: 30S ribosomal protein S16 [Bacteroidetes bacterium]|nr:30S ribosomal protein S16 [Bacteroidota bacterium]MBU1115982.1 30S ribosomal protein S16 [Bacteroidota bacterium]MBU1798421.1 30S ribosomal protein S16 [Bacteroidota bacterium]
MAVKIRLRRMGKKRQPIYKVVAADERSPRDGKFIEIIGMYNPITNPATIEIKEERALYWLGVGAQPTTTVKGLLSKLGILYKRDLLSSGLKEEEITLKLEEWLKNKEAKLASKAAKKVIVKATKDEKKIEEIVSDSEGTVSEELQEEKAE